MTFAKVLDDLDAVISEGEKKASALARVYYKQARPLWGPHSSLQVHGVVTPITDSGLLRVDDKGLLVAPVLRKGKMVSAMLIAEDGTREPWPVVPMDGGYCWTHLAPQSTTVVSSSLPVALACVNALRGVAKPARALICWMGLDDVTPVGLSGFLVVASSKDERDAADVMAAKIGAGVACPTGSTMGNSYCDLRLEAIQARVAKKVAHKSAIQIERDVDAGLAMALSKAAVWVPPAVGKEPNQGSGIRAGVNEGVRTA